MRGKTRKRKVRVMQDGADQGGEEDARPPKGEHLGGDIVRDNEEREQHYASWRRTNSLCEQGIPNIAVWGSSTKRENGGLPAPGPDPALALNHSLTTLPLPGDAPNPLAMLAEASASAQAVQLSTPGAAIGASPVAGAGTTGPSAGQDDSTDSYYAPFQKRLKDDAPHIMTLISVSESVITLTSCEGCRRGCPADRSGLNSYSIPTSNTYTRTSLFLIPLVRLQLLLLDGTTSCLTLVRLGICSTAEFESAASALGRVTWFCGNGCDAASLASRWSGYLGKRASR